MSWGPLDANGKPVSRKSGSDWLKWRERIKSYGYTDEWKEMNAADFGANTSRNRLFGIFAKEGLPIAWPAATHAKNPEKQGEMFGKKLKKWKAVRHVLELEVKGESIFTRKKPLSPKTMQRIYAGLVKFVAGGKEAFLVKYNSRGSNGNYAAPDMDQPLHTIPTRNMHYVAQPEFISKYYSGKPDDKNISINGPAGTITCKDGQAIVQAEFILNYQHSSDSNSVDQPSPTVTTKDKYGIVQTQFLSAYYSGGDNVSSIDGPSPTIRTKDGIAIVDPQFIMRDFQTTSNTSIEEPARTILPVPKQHLVTAEPFIVNQNYSNGPESIDKPASTVTANRKWQYIVNPQWFNQNASSIEDPHPTLIARMDKTPPYLVTTEAGYIAIEVYESDCEYTVKIKEFMALYGIMDIKMRMLMIPELLRIQGFPKHYKLVGTQGDQKKFIGNSVVPHVVTAWTVAMIAAVDEYYEKLLAA
jgi:DNA (cytosine-5)-methyltransferase 1